MKIAQKFNHLRRIGLVMSVCLIGVSCSKSEPTPGGGMSTNVVGFKTHKEELSDTIPLVGTLYADEKIEIKSELNGTIDEIKFKEGQKVQKGNVLIQIDSSKLQAAFDQRNADLQLAQTTSDRYERLVESKAVSRQEYDETKAALESAIASKALTREQLEDATITAPFDGVMGARMVSGGQYVSQGTLLSYLYSRDPMRIEFHLPERYLGKAKIGQTLKLRVAAYEDKEYEGTLYFINPRIEERTRTVLLKGYVPNPYGKLFDGMFANVDLVLDLNKDALVIPETALIIKGDEVSVYVVMDDGTVESRVLTLGKRFEGMVAVTEGLYEGDIVVTEGFQKIGPGSKVNVRLETKSQKQFYEII